jgi:cation:H+ antiporter
MIAVAVATLPIFFSGYAIVRWEGAVFLAFYLAYMLYLVLDATEHAAIAPFSAAMTWFILPLTGLTLAVVAWRSSGRGLCRASR